MATRCCIALVERRIFEEEQDVLYQSRIASSARVSRMRLALRITADALQSSRITSGERLLLLVGGQLGQQERMADANFIRDAERCR